MTEPSTTNTTGDGLPSATEGFTPEALREALRPVIDPEIGISIVDLGLIYETKMVDGTTAHVLMTLTSPMCPMGPQIMNEVHGTVAALVGVKDVKVELTFQPPWDPRTMASDDARMMMGIF